jgi:ABC-type dipeptide/oligopeptide/nickel transport system ATPase subunit
VGAGVELPLRASDGSFAHLSRPWAITEVDDHVWVDADVLRDGTDALSGGERRVLAVVATLIDECPVDVVDVGTGLDWANLHLVIALLAHAARSLEHADVTIGPGGASHVTRPGPVVAWPT